MISLVLLEKIVQLFLILIAAYVAVKLKLLKSEDSQVLSKVALYIINPCTMIAAFQIDRTDAMVRAMGLSLLAAVTMHVVYFILNAVLRRPLRLSRVEQASMIYSNGGNLIIPLVLAIFGAEYVVFTTVFCTVQVCLLWSHCRVLVSGEKKFSVRQIVTNINFLSVVIGAGLFFLNIRLPGVIAGALDCAIPMMGPMGMIITGMLMAEVDLKEVFRQAGVWKVMALRLVVLPAVVALVFRLSGAGGWVPEGDKYLLISYLAACSPAAVSVTMLDQLYGSGGKYASAINVGTTIACVATMPLMTALLQM